MYQTSDLQEPGKAVNESTYRYKMSLLNRQERGEEKDPLCLESFERLNYFSF